MADIELQAMDTVRAFLDGLDQAARERVLNWAWDRYVEGHAGECRASVASSPAEDAPEQPGAAPSPAGSWEQALANVDQAIAHGLPELAASWLDVAQRLRRMVGR